MVRIANNKFICYYINLDIDMSRNDHCLRLLDELNFDEINRIVPYDKCSKFIKDDEDKCKKCFNHKYFGKPRGYKSLTMTTKYIFEQILKRDDDTFYFIFEDDIEIHNEIDKKNFKNYIVSEFKKLNDNTDFIYLGLIIPNTEVENTKKPFNPMLANGYATHAYVLNKNAIKNLFQLIPCWHFPIDGMYRHFLRVPLIGFDYCATKYGPGYRGIFYQDREAPWYDGTRINTNVDISMNIEYNDF